MMRFRGALGAMLLLTTCANAWAIDTFAGGQLQIPALIIGSESFTNVKVSIGSIVSGPTGTAPMGSVDSFDPTSGELTVPAVIVGGNTYYNVVATVENLLSIGGASGVDQFAGGELSIVRATDGIRDYANAVIQVGQILYVDGGMPYVTTDTYTSFNNSLLIPAVSFGGQIYTNVNITVAGIVSEGQVTLIPAPTLTEVFPDQALAGSSGVTVNVTGVGFTKNSVVQIYQQALPTTYVSASHLIAQLSENFLTNPGAAPVNVTSGVSGEPPSNTLSFTITAAPLPVLYTLSPRTVATQGPDFTLTVNGTDFTPSSFIYWNGSSASTTYVSPTELQAQIQSFQIDAAGTYAVTVMDPLSGSVASNALSVLVGGSVAPTLSQLSPAAATAGGPSFSLAVSGSNFTPTTVILWNGSPQPTSFSSPTLISTTIVAADIATPASIAVTVEDPATGDTPSAPVTFPVTAALTPVVTRVAPAAVTVGGPAFMVTVIGTGFAPLSQVLWNGTALPTTYRSATLLTANVASAQIAALGSAQVSVSTLGLLSGNQTLAIVAAGPSDATGFLMNPAHTGAVTFKSVAFPTSAAWSANVGGQPSYAIIANGAVYLTVQTTGGDAQLLALSAATGATLWGPVALQGAGNAAYDNGVLFVLGGGKLQAFNATTGTSLWTMQPAGQTTFNSPPTAASGLVFLVGGGSGATLYAFDETSGATVWTQNIQADAYSTPAVTADGVYLIYPSCQAYDFLPSVGFPVWSDSLQCSGPFQGSAAVIANGVIFAAGQTPMLNAQTGAATGPFRSDYSPAVTAAMGYTILNDEQGAYSVNAVTLSDNTVGWSFAADPQVNTSPVAINQYVVFGSASGKLYALDGTTGQQVWTQNLGSPIAASPFYSPQLPYSGLAAGDGLLVVPTETSVSAYVLSTSP